MGHRRAYHDARGEGWTVNHKKLQRLWREEGLQVPQRRRRKRLGTSTATTVTADAPNRVWAVDFQVDATTDPLSMSTPASAWAAWSPAPSPAALSSAN